ncbi:MAG: hypothetical protein OXE46_10890 [Chloroflexi bacterium]|nr:hypothetical protein [Chloroflexota bacterium]
MSTIMGPALGQGTGESKEGQGEHQSANSENEGESGGESGEEAGTELALDEVYDEVRGGARLILVYDAAIASFIGTVENITDALLQQVRVEVHLSNGLELGPTTPVDLAPGEKVEVVLVVFDSFSAHAEVGTSEANHAPDSAGESAGGEHGGGDSGEHGSGGDGD